MDAYIHGVLIFYGACYPNFTVAVVIQPQMVPHWLLSLHGYEWLWRMVRFHHCYNFWVCDFSGYLWGCQVSHEPVCQGPTHCQQHCPLSFSFGDGVCNEVEFQLLNIHVPRLLCWVKLAYFVVIPFFLSPNIVFIHLQTTRTVGGDDFLYMKYLTEYGIVRNK